MNNNFLTVSFVLGLMGSYGIFLSTLIDVTMLHVQIDAGLLWSTCCNRPNRFVFE